MAHLCKRSNGSPNPEVEKIAREYASYNTRISYYRQTENRGWRPNFQFVLKKAQGRYFMWAADDDFWEPFYVEKLVFELEKLGSDFVAATFEAQYCDENLARFDFFPEGVPFYSFQSSLVMERIKHTLVYNYGNLFYSLYRLEILNQLDLIYEMNEIPFLLQISRHGNWRVLPEVGFFKKTVLSTYNKARWEKTGGFAARRSLKAAWGSLKYHRLALDNIRTAIDTLNLSIKDRVTLKSLAGKTIWKHWIYLLISYKPRPF